MRAESPKTINALARGLEVLRLIQITGGLRLKDLHTRSGIPKASLLRILRTLEEQGAIWQRMADGAYVPSYSLSELAGRLDREAELVEVASPILERLTGEIAWPSVLAVPRMTYMEVIETNAPRAYHDEIRLGPVGFKINMLRSASGRAFLAACDGVVREAVLDRLRASARPGDRLAHDADAVARILSETANRGYGLRDSDFGGHYDEGRGTSDDGRDSLGVAIRMGHDAVGALNVTWSRRSMPRSTALDRLAQAVIDAAREIEDGLS